MSSARIYQSPKNSMQSGRANTDRWMLEFEPAPKFADPLTGWTGSADTQQQVKLPFPTMEAAVAYADKHAIQYHLVPATERKLKLQAYADNFR